MKKNDTKKGSTPRTAKSTRQSGRGPQPEAGGKKIAAVPRNKLLTADPDPPTISVDGD